MPRARRCIENDVGSWDVYIAGLPRGRAHIGFSFLSRSRKSCFDPNANMPRYIRLNPLKQTLREDARIAHSWKVRFLWIPKLLRKKREFTSAIPIPIPFQDFVVKPEEVSPDAEAKLEGPLGEAARLGFTSPIYQSTKTLGGECENDIAS